MKRYTTHLFTALIILALTACASSYPLRTADGVYTNLAGMTLYTFDKDIAHSGKSTCNHACATLWPPVAPSGNLGGDYAAITRDDGSKQLTFRGKPVYLYVKDKAPGDKFGDGVNGVWHVIFHYYTDPTM